MRLKGPIDFVFAAVNSGHSQAVRKAFGCLLHLQSISQCSKQEDYHEDGDRPRPDETPTSNSLVGRAHHSHGLCDSELMREGTYIYTMHTLVSPASMTSGMVRC